MVLLTLLVFCFVLSAAFDSHAAAASGETVRVGYYPLENYHAENENGEVEGYEADYLSRVSEITGWNIEYVRLASWEKGMEALRNGEIDLLSPSQFTTERDAEFLFSSLPLGKTYGAVMALNTNECIYEDFEAFSRMTFGVEKGSIHSETFAAYASEHQFTPDIMYYKDFESMVEALNAGEIDALVDNIMRTQKTMSLLGRFGTSQYYFMANKNDRVLMSGLNEAMYQIDVESPQFEQELRSRYFPVFDAEILTKEEIEFAQGMRELIVGCPVNTDPVSYLDKESGETAGITRDILDRVAANTGLKFKYEALPAGQVTYEDLRAKGVDLIACVEYNSVNAKSPGVHLSSPYFQAKKVVVCKKDTEFDIEKELTLAIVSGSQTLGTVLKNTYPSFHIVTYETPEQCLEAVKSGEADAMLHNQYSIDRLLQKPRYESLNALAAEGIGDAQSLSPVLYKSGNDTLDEDLSNPLLIKVINKGINNITEDEISKILIDQTTKRRYQFTLGDFIYRYQYMCMAVIAALAAAGCAAAYSMRIKKKNLEILRNSEKQLENITNNINGGVLILQPDRELHLLYANEGFWNLLEYDADRMKQPEQDNYVMYVHEDDKEQLAGLMEKADEGDAGSVSLRLRVRRRDGSYIPALFNGTLAADEQGLIKLYCVIMDISQEVAIQEQLKLEEQKHQLLIDKTEQIVYEIQFAQKEIKTSESFCRKFGWRLMQTYKRLDAAEILSIWRVHPEDQAAFTENFRKSLDGLEDTNITVRLMLADGRALWCSVSQFIMLDSEGNPLEILGLIRDVDRDMREKKNLAEKSRMDPLTGLYNKEAFRRESKEYLRQNLDEECAVLFVDLDHFKNINDLLGHMEGDKAIKDAAQTLKAIFSSQDVVGRFGGDEFCVLVKDITMEALTRKVEWLREKLRCIYSNGKYQVQITASIGVTTSMISGFDLGVLLEHADTALYRSKDAGRNCYTFYGTEE